MAAWIATIIRRYRDWLEWRAYRKGEAVISRVQRFGRLLEK